MRYLAFKTGVSGFSACVFEIAVNAWPADNPMKDDLEYKAEALMFTHCQKCNPICEPAWTGQNDFFKCFIF